MICVVCMVIVCFFMAFYQRTKANDQSATAVVSNKVSTLTSKQAIKEDTVSIVLDAGHGGYDSGGVAIDGSLEKDITLSITLRLGALLEEQGFQIVYTREQDEVSWPSDNLSDLQERIEISEQAQADYYISIHTNFSAYQDGAQGFESYINFENDTVVAMAENIHTSLNSLSYSIDRGLKDTTASSLYVIDHNTTPALLLELGFLSDSEDASYLTSSQGQQQLAQTIADGIVETFNK